MKHQVLTSLDWNNLVMAKKASVASVVPKCSPWNEQRGNAGIIQLLFSNPSHTPSKFSLEDFFFFSCKKKKNLFLLSFLRNPQLCPPQGWNFPKETKKIKINAKSYLVQQVEDLGEDVKASPWVYWGLIEEPCLGIKQKFCLNKSQQELILCQTAK